MKKRDSLYEIFRSLSPTDEQLVFRDVMRRLYTPMLNNWCNLPSVRSIKPEKDYLETFDLSNRRTIDYITGVELRSIVILVKAGILKNATKHHEELDSRHFRLSKPTVYSFAYEVVDIHAFFDLYEQIFEPDEQINPRTALNYEVKTGVLRIRKSGHKLLKVNEGMKPDMLLREIFLNEKEIVRIEEIPNVVIRGNEKMKHILKQKVYTSFLKFGSDYIRLKTKVSRKELESYAKE